MKCVQNALTVVLMFLACLDFRILLVAAATPSAEEMGERAAVTRLQSYLQIDTRQPFPDYFSATDFVVRQGLEIGMQFKILEREQQKFIVLLTWEGTEPELPSILLNSHIDVVPANETKWTYPPLSGQIDSDGRIFARGAQNMKSVGMQYLEAVRNLMAQGFKPKRTLHISFLPDKEIGGADGSLKFFHSKDFKDLNVALVLDEGIVSPDDSYRVFNAERPMWWFYVIARGSPAHGSRMIDGLALENLKISLDKIADFRNAEIARVKAGLITEDKMVSINNVFLKAGTPTPTGFVMNLQPSEAAAGFDMRLPLIDGIEATLEKLLAEEWAPASRNMSSGFLIKHGVKNDMRHPAITVANDSNPWWVLFKKAVEKTGGKLHDPEVLHWISTDARFIRNMGIPAFGFAPFTNTSIRIHEDNEFVSVKEYLKGIKVYEELIKCFTLAQ